MYHSYRHCTERSMNVRRLTHVSRKGWDSPAKSKIALRAMPQVHVLNVRAQPYLLDATIRIRGPFMDSEMEVGGHRAR